MSADSPDFSAITGRQQQTWATGDFNAIAMTIMSVAESLVAAADPRAGQRVLDVACGSGNTALVAARRFCEVTGVDYVPALLERARQRAAADGVGAEFREADAQALPFPDASFDVVLSTFGVMFAPDQRKAADELLRVCRPGGQIGLACWMPEGFGLDFFKVITKYVPPPPAVPPALRWGSHEGLQDLLGAGTSDIHAERRICPIHFRSVEHAVDMYRKFFGPMARACDMLPAGERDALLADVAEVFSRYNTSEDGTLVVAADYLEIVATRAG